MAVVGISGFCITLPKLIKNGEDGAELVDKSLDLLTITVPPALPATMSVGVAFAISRLKKSKIFCISPPRVNVSGMIQIMVFDKTGTLTEDGLEILGVRACQGRLDSPSKFTAFKESIKNHLPNDTNHVENLDNKAVVMNEAMASCHAITYVGDDLVGDPLEIRMFESTKWVLDEQQAGTNSVLDSDSIVLAKVHPQNSDTVSENKPFSRQGSFASDMTAD